MGKRWTFGLWVSDHESAAPLTSTGVTFYCMLTGKLPFNVANPMDLFAMVREKE
jgi:[calcium/calmodulin-dependent protein kinase] kinase